MTGEGRWDRCRGVIKRKELERAILADEALLKAQGKEVENVVKKTVLLRLDEKRSRGPDVARLCWLKP